MSNYRSEQLASEQLASEQLSVSNYRGEQLTSAPGVQKVKSENPSIVGKRVVYIYFRSHTSPLALS